MVISNKQFAAWERDRLANTVELGTRVLWKMADELCLGVWWANDSQPLV